MTALGRFNAKPTPQERLRLRDVLKLGTSPGLEPLALSGAVEVVGQSGVAANVVAVMGEAVGMDLPVQPQEMEEIRHAA